MGVRIEGSDGGTISVVAGTADTAIKTQWDAPGFGAVDVFSVSGPGQVRIAAQANDADPYPQGLKLVRNFGGGATDFDIDDDTNSVLFVVDPALSGKKKCVVPQFTASGGTPRMMMADDAINTGSGPDVANGWILTRGLKVNVGATPASVGGLVGAYDVTGRTASLGATTLLASAPVGTYVMQVYIEDETAGGGTVAVSISFRNSNGTTSVPLSFWNGSAQVSTLTLNAAIALDFSSAFQLYNFTSGNITIAVTVAGTVQFSLRARLFRID